MQKEEKNQLSEKIENVGTVVLVCGVLLSLIFLR